MEPEVRTTLWRHFGPPAAGLPFSRLINHSKRFLPFQWVDISETQPGTYWLRSEIDPFDLPWTLLAAVVLVVWLAR